ncbi:MAG: hypothetical protein O7D91_17620 [Planctomycetota bacterium]|nr:hypothetical protein [Planctomycetota bacterium]
MSIDRDQIALDVLLALVRHEPMTPLTPEGVAEYCQVAYAFADGLLEESVRKAEAEESVTGGRLTREAVDAAYPECAVGDASDSGRVLPVLVDEEVVVIDTDPEPDAEPKIDTESKAARTKRINIYVQGIYDAYPRKVSKVQAIKRIVGVLQGGWGAADLLRRTKAFAATNPHKGLPARHPENFCPYPSTWYYQGGYQDDAFDEGAAEDVTTNRFLTEEATDAG